MKRQQTVLYSALVAILALCVIACGSTSFLDGFFDQFSLQGTNESMADIAGNWTATSATFSRSAAGPVLDVEIIGQGGTATLVIQATGRFTFTWQLPGDPPVVVTGQLAFDEDLLVVSDDADPEEWEFYAIQFSGNTMFLGGPAEFDFDGDTIAEAAILSMDLIR